jgi:hypothetical protein
MSTKVKAPFSVHPAAVGRVSQVGWELPSDLSEAEWCQAGVMLGRVERSVAWWLGDWWAFAEAHYGECKAVVEADDWGGTCNADISEEDAKETSPATIAPSLAHDASHGLSTA